MSKHLKPNERRRPVSQKQRRGVKMSTCQFLFCLISVYLYLSTSQEVLFPIIRVFFIFEDVINIQSISQLGVLCTHKLIINLVSEGNLYPRNFCAFFLCINLLWTQISNKPNACMKSFKSYLCYRIQAPPLIRSQSAGIKKTVLWNYMAAKVKEL